MVDFSNMEEYADPVLYDLENGRFEPDGPFLLALAQQVGQPVLELGCGTGRITIPLAEHGLDMTGLDIAPAMLAEARRKAGDLPVRWIEADVRTFRLDRQFRFIFTSGGTFQHLLTRADQEAMLARVREHLAPGGRFVLDTIFPHPRLFTTAAEEQEWFSYEDSQGRKIRVSGTEYYDHVRQIKIETAYRRWHNARGEEVTREAPLALRYTFPQEMGALLHYNGFKIEHCYGDWNSGPLTNESRIMVYVCRQDQDTDSEG